MKTVYTKLVSALLALVLLVGILPIPASAAEGGYILTISDGVSGTAEVEVGKTVTLNVTTDRPVNGIRAVVTYDTDLFSYTEDTEKTGKIDVSDWFATATTAIKTLTFTAEEAGTGTFGFDNTTSVFAGDYDDFSQSNAQEATVVNDSVKIEATGSDDSCEDGHDWDVANADYLWLYNNTMCSVSTVCKTCGQPFEDAVETTSATLSNGSTRYTAVFTDAEVLNTSKTVPPTTSSDTEKETIEVTFRLIGDSSHSSPSKHEEYVTWIPTTSYTVEEGDSVYDLFVEAMSDYGLSYSLSYRGTSYITGIKAPSVLGGYWLSASDNGPNSGWMYTVDGVHPTNGIKDQTLNSGDAVIFHYVDNYATEENAFTWLEAKDRMPTAAADAETDISEIITITGEGTVEPALTENHIGKTVTFTFKAKDGYKIKDVIIDGVSKGAIETYTYKKLSLDSRIEVIFEKDGDVSVDSFVDVSESDWFYDDVQYAVEQGLFNGTGDSKFSPNAPMNRAMLVTVLYRQEAEPDVIGTSIFDDVAANQWYTDAVIWATKNEIVNGYGNGKFGPTDNITREQMAAILFRYAEYKDYDVSASNVLTSYADFTEISAYALKPLKWAKAEGLITGRTATTLAPKGTATRAEVAATLHRFVENVVNED